MDREYNVILKDGEQIYLTMYCDLCGYNMTGQMGFYLKGKEYCVGCYPMIVNAYLATERLKEGQCDDPR